MITFVISWLVVYLFKTTLCKLLYSSIMTADGKRFIVAPRWDWYSFTGYVPDHWKNRPLDREHYT